MQDNDNVVSPLFMLLSMFGEITKVTTLTDTIRVAKLTHNGYRTLSSMSINFEKGEIVQTYKFTEQTVNVLESPITPTISVNGAAAASADDDDDAADGYSDILLKSHLASNVESKVVLASNAEGNDAAFDGQHVRAVRRRLMKKSAPDANVKA